nr:N-6 DNA methylase [Burkholderia ambifaria]
MGIYYTPDNAAKIVATWAIRSLADRILEPSFGGCALLRAAADHLQTLGAPRPLENLVGYDIDINAFHYLSELNGSNTDGDFLNLDFVETRPESRDISVIIANPPFTGYRKMTDAQRKTVAAWQEENPDLIPLDASLWAYFLLHSLSFLAEGGRLAFVLPASLISADYASKVRTRIESHFHEVKYIQVQNQLFLQEGASARAVILLADQFKLSRHAACTVTRHSVTDIHEISEILFSRPNEDFENSSDTLNELQFQRASKYLADNNSIFFLGDVSQVLIGEVVGDVKFLIKNQSEWASLGIEAAYTKPIIRHHSTIPGLLVSHGDKKALPRILNIGNRPHSDAVSTFLNTYPKEARDSNSTFKKRKVWHQASYETNADAFIPSLTHRHLRIIANTEKVSCTNSTYKIIINDDSPLTGTALACASLTTITQLSAELLSRTLGEGALKLEPSDVRKIAIPTSALSMSNAESAIVMRELEPLIKSEKFDKARKLADYYFLINKKIATKESIDILEKKLLNLRQTRLSRSA